MSRRARAGKLIPRRQTGRRAAAVPMRAEGCRRPAALAPEADRFDRNHQPGVGFGSPFSVSGETNMAEAKEKTTPVKLLYDVWAAGDRRVSKGTVLDLPVKAAKALIQQGKASRADPLPGDTE
ncbi:hypothetical protein GOC91_23295 [Sinorhizobium medicae]|uniref:Uncharacterized protein n=3 Tax=Sinorhizobium medicae TaxID=110321 RepID=A6UAH9_SINMW|nr:hypothetical protein Smed_1824 [Sinorhizobium medicae WSM419]MDX0406492.1 hypothetical protein [Sinorhizobium medicae]MDX0413043.1 hypothetical protein [Sinorhizobium medicae]MDX0418844.1 hypothetical protein [Sinorhizobium medicae]MDX0430313.1 hypothetical protein [Sinorhizobium medicae]